MAAGTKARWGQRGLLQLAIPTSEPQTMQNNDGQTSKNSIIHIALPTFLSSCAQLWLSVFVSACPLVPWSTPVSLPTAVPGPPLLFPLRCFNSTGCGAHTPLGLDRPPMFFVILKWGVHSNGLRLATSFLRAASQARCLLPSAPPLASAA